MMNLKAYTLPQWLEYLENRHHEEIQLGLTRIRHVAARLNLLHFDQPIITVGGTNGKGSTVASLVSIYQTMGYSVGSYTSPHLIAFNERICINQQPVDDDRICSAFCLIEEARQDIHLTYFEQTTLAALVIFKQLPLDIIILEVGMGGRLDATNIIDATIAILTSVDLDHQAYLGDTREAIGHEKAGIFRANQIAIYAEPNPPQSVLDAVEKLNVNLYRLQRDYQYSQEQGQLTVFFNDGENVSLSNPLIHPQALSAAIMAARCLKHLLPVNEAKLDLAVKNIRLRGRKDLIRGEVNTLLDVSHNEQSVLSLVDFVLNLHPKNKVHAVFGALQDKDSAKLIQLMKPLVDYWYPALLQSNRAIHSKALLALLNAELQTEQVCYTDPVCAYDAARTQAKKGDLIIVFGSFLTVSPVLKAYFIKQQEISS